MRSLFAPRPMPYYVYAPDYRRSSAGIRVMHMLCDALNRSGHEAYVVAEVMGPDLVTPKLTQEAIKQHQAAGLTPIAVYPEVVDGNPLKCDVVVRYLLNRLGFIAGSGSYEENDILFAYKRDFAFPGFPEKNFLFLPAVDPNIFCPPADPRVRIPGRICYYLGRNTRIDPELLPLDAIQITAESPDSWQGLAELFQQCEFLYLGEASGLAYEAGLCGCLPVVISEEWCSIESSSRSFVAFGLDPGEIERAREFLPAARTLLNHQRKAFWHELDYFIEVTQQAAAKVGSAKKNEHANWLAARLPTPMQRRHIESYLERNGGGPRIGILVLDTEGHGEKLKVTLESIERCLYPQLETLVLSSVCRRPNDDSAVDKHLLSVEWSDGIEQLNRKISGGSYEWLIVLNAGDELALAGLLVAAMDLIGSGDCRAVYGDEVMRQEGVLGAALRPDLNLDLLLSLPSAMSRHWLFNRQTLVDMGGFRASAGRAFELDYILRLVESQGLVGLGHISEPLLICNALTVRDDHDEIAVISQHLHARGFTEAAVHSRLPGHYNVDYGHREQPRVSILIVVEDRLAWVQRCLESLLEKTAYSNFEVLLIDHGNTKHEVKEWLAAFEQMGAKGLRVLRFGGEASRQQVQNQAAVQAAGEYLLWLGDGAGILSADWLKQLLNHALRPEVGAVGAKLISGDGTILHAGGVLGLGGPVGRAYVGSKVDAPGYLQRLQIDQNCSALSGLCLMLRRELFMELGGFDEDPLLSRWADTDLCLRLQQAGYLNVWTPRVQLLMDEPASPVVSTEEEDAMYARWLPALARDPAYNPNFALDRQGFRLASVEFTWKPLEALGTVPLVLAHNADKTGCGCYRIIQPHRALKKEGLIEGVVTDKYLTVTELERYNPDAIILQRQIGEEHYELIRRMKVFSRAFKVFELDDYLTNLPLKNAHRADLPKDIVKALRRALGCVDRFVVSTNPLAEAFAGWHGDVQVVQNSLDPLFWRNLVSQRRVSGKPRVGWAGGVSHTGDLEMVADVVRELAGEVEWVFFGMCPDKLRPYVHEYHPGVNIELYPAALAKMNLDLAIAPVEENRFNECKSNLRLLEYGACGFPVVCSDLICYRGDLPVTRVRNRFKDWVDAIRMHLADLDATAKLGDELRAAVHRDWMLEGDNLEAWRKAWLPG